VISGKSNLIAAHLVFMWL